MERASVSIRSRIFQAIHQIAKEQRIALPPLRDDMLLFETGFDSLALAILVARLEDELGSDPLASEDAVLPSTLGDLVGAYENVVS